MAELPATSMLDLYGIRGHLGTVETEDDTSLRAVAKVPQGARIVVTKSPGTGAAREVEWIFEPPLSAGTSVVEQQVGKLELSPAPGEPKAVLGLATPRKADGARWPVRVRVRFEGKAGGPITRIAAYRDGPAARGRSAPSTAGLPASTSSGLLPQCPSLVRGRRRDGGRRVAVLRLHRHDSASTSSGRAATSAVVGPLRGGPTRRGARPGRATP